MFSKENHNLASCLDIFILQSSVNVTSALIFEHLVLFSFSVTNFYTVSAFFAICDAIRLVQAKSKTCLRPVSFQIESFMLKQIKRCERALACYKAVKKVTRALQK